MHAKLKMILIVQLFGVLIAVVLVAAPDASAFRLSMNGGNSLRVETPAALYVTDPGGSLLKIVTRGASVPGGGTIADFGIPAIAADGSVIFGADLRGEHVGWRIFRADLNASGGVRIARALGDSERGAACRPVLKSDLQPVVTGDGSLAFIASDQLSRSTLFRYTNGRLDCLVRTGDRTAEGHVISSLGFGSAAAAEDGSVIFGGSIVGEREAGGREDSRTAILVVGLRGRAQEIAVEGSRAEDGKRYGRGFGLPSISDSSGGALVSFVNRGGDESSLFVGTAKHPHRATTTGVHTNAGTLIYLSLGRPSMAEDGTVAVKAASGEHTVIVVVRSGEPVVVAQDGDRPSGMAVTDADPAALRAGRLYVQAVDAESREHVLSLSAAPLGGTPLRGAAVISGALSVYPESVNVNRKGAVAFLEESDERSGSNAADRRAASEDAGSI
ncbi:MAG: hypothetical protein JO121_23905 [Deltaproteobacteria bacterium]|nr:hypothetical protein [Deltaproteobacteria bacterium]